MYEQEQNQIYSVATNNIGVFTARKWRALLRFSSCTISDDSHRMCKTIEGGRERESALLHCLIVRGKNECALRPLRRELKLEHWLHYKHSLFVWTSSKACLVSNTNELIFGICIRGMSCTLCTRTLSLVNLKGIVFFLGFRSLFISCWNDDTSSSLCGWKPNPHWDREEAHRTDYSPNQLHTRMHRASQFHGFLNYALLYKERCNVCKEKCLLNVRFKI